MTLCTCSMSAPHVLSALPSCPSSQINSARGFNGPERPHGVFDSLVVNLRRVSKVKNLEGRGRSTSSKLFSSRNAEASSNSIKIRGRQIGVGGSRKEDSKARTTRKPTAVVQYRVQDAVDSWEADYGTEKSRRSNRDRSRRQKNGEQRRRVQILGNNGIVDLEEPLGLISEDDSESGEDYRGDETEGMDVETMMAAADEEGRRLLESSLRNGVADLQSREDGGGSTSTSGRAPKSDWSEFYSRTAEADRSAGLSDKTDANMPEQKERYSQQGHGQLGSQRIGPLAEIPGGRRVAELVGAWDGLVRRMPPEFSRTGGPDLLLRALKLTVTAFQHTAADNAGRTPFCRALAVAHNLVDLEMDAEVVSAGLLSEVIDAGVVNITEIEKNLGEEVASILRDYADVSHVMSRMEALTDDSAKALRQLCLAVRDIRTLVVRLARQLDTMQHINFIPKYQQRILALEAMQIYAPLAHAVGTVNMASELEDLGFGVLFPDSYAYVDKLLKSHWRNGSETVVALKHQLLAKLKDDTELQKLVHSVKVLGRLKSRFSIMRKLLRDGRKAEEVYDILGLRVVLEPNSVESNGMERRAKGARACYRSREITESMWLEVIGRTKDYIANRKMNGYESLHQTVLVSDEYGGRMPMEIQFRTTDMDAVADSGRASHSLYKGQLTDPEQVRNLKEGMVAAASAAASRFGEIAGNAVSSGGGRRSWNEKDQIFNMFDKNHDGVISIEELKDVITELGEDEADALELMHVVDLNTDGEVSAEEFGNFRHQIQVYQNLCGIDRECSSQLGSQMLWDSKSEEGRRAQTSGRLSGNTYQDVGLKMDQPSSPAPPHAVAKGGGSKVPELVEKPKPNSVHAAELYTPSSPKTSLEVDDMAGQPSSVQSSEIKDTSVVEEVELVSKETAIEQTLSVVRQQECEGNLPAARELIARLSKDYPGSTKVLLRQANLERKCGNLDGGSALYAQAIDVLEFNDDLGDEYLKALQAWASLEAQAGNLDRARHLYISSIDACQEHDTPSFLKSGVHGLHGWAMLEQNCGNWTKARDLLERAATIQPGNAVIHQSRASFEAQAHNYSGARIHFTRATKAAPEDVRCWHAWAKFEASRGNVQKMRNLFKRALEVDPKNMHALQAWAHHEGRIGTPESRSQARKLFQNCVDINPDNVYCWQSWGILEEKSENYEGARVLFTRGLEANARSVPCLLAYAHMERKCGNLDLARALLRRALVLEQKNAAVLMEMAIVEDASGDADTAADFFKQASILDRKKSTMKKRIFDSRKRDLQINGSLSKPRASGRSRRKTSQRKVSADGFSNVPYYENGQLEREYGRVLVPSER